MPVTSWKNPRTKSLLIAGALSLSSCIGPFRPSDEPNKIHWGWEQTLMFTTDAGREKKVFLEWNDLEAVPEISKNIKQNIAITLKDKHGLIVTEKSEEADYFVQLQLRYFNGNGKADRGANIVKSAGTIGGGRPGWIIHPGQGPGDPEPVKPIPDQSEGGGMFSKKEWVLLIDVAVGERGGDPTYADKIVLRCGRLVGYVTGKGLTQDDALSLFKYGKLPPIPPEPINGVMPASYVAPDPNAPPDALLQVLIPGILPLVN